MIKALTENGLFPINYWALLNNGAQTQLLYPKSHQNRDMAQRSYILAPCLPYNHQYGYGIPLVQLYRGDGNDYFMTNTSSSKSKKLIPLNHENPPDSVD